IDVGDAPFEWMTGKAGNFDISGSARLNGRGVCLTQLYIDPDRREIGNRVEQLATRDRLSVNDLLGDHHAVRGRIQRERSARLACSNHLVDLRLGDIPEP